MNADQTARAAETPNMRILMLLVAGVLFMEFLDGTVITTALPAMARSFAVSAIDLNAGISAYLFALGVFIPISSWAADRYGARRIFSSAIIIFTVASLFCGLANGLVTFIAVRVMQGLGGAMMVPVGRLIVLRHTPKDRLISTIATLVWPALVAPVLGPMIGGLIATYANWRWIFYLNIPLGLFALATAMATVPDMRAETSRPFDWRGFFLSSSGILMFLYGAELFTGANVNITRATFAIMGGALLLVAAFSYLKRAAAPMLDLHAFGIPTFAAALRGGSLARAAIGSAPFLLPLMFQLGFGFDAVRSGFLVTAVFIGNLVMKSMTSPILRRFGFRHVLVWNGVFSALWLFACAFLSPDTPQIAVLLFLFVGGLTRSLQFTTINTVAFADVPQQQIGPANALFSTVFQLSLGAGVAFGAIAIRLGSFIARTIGAHSHAMEYHIAFALVSLAALISLVDAIQLERGSGDEFAGRESKAISRQQ